MFKQRVVDYAPSKIALERERPMYDNRFNTVTNYDFSGSIYKVPVVNTASEFDNFNPRAASKHVLSPGREVGYFKNNSQAPN